MFDAPTRLGNIVFSAASTNDATIQGWLSTPNGDSEIFEYVLEVGSPVTGAEIVASLSLIENYSGMTILTVDEDIYVNPSNDVDIVCSGENSIRISAGSYNVYPSSPPILLGRLN